MFRYQFSFTNYEQMGYDFITCSQIKLVTISLTDLTVASASLVFLFTIFWNRQGKLETSWAKHSNPLHFFCGQSKFFRNMIVNLCPVIQLVMGFISLPCHLLANGEVIIPNWSWTNSWLVWVRWPQLVSGQFLFKGNIRKPVDIET